MRATNLGTVLRLVHDRGAISRARIADEARLSKASVTSLVSELADRGLVREDAAVRTGVVGRPGTDVVLAAGRAVGIGAEISLDGVRVLARDLTGEVVHRGGAALPREGADALPLMTAQQLDRAIGVVAGTGAAVIGAVIAAPGVLDVSRGAVLRATSLGWSDVPLARTVGDNLSAPLSHLSVDNDARLSALASHRERAHLGVHDLLFLTGGDGVAAGMIAGGALIRGGSGFSGEVGHMMIDPDGPRCRCGKRGCWETRVGLGALLDSFGEGSGVHAPSLGLSERLSRIESLLAAGDATAARALERIEQDLARGAGMLVDVLDPGVLVLGGYFGRFADRFVPTLVRALEPHALGGIGRVRVEASALGADAAAMGGALLALERVLEDPTVVARPTPG